MTYLELVQAAAFESGTVPGKGQPLTVDNQTGRLHLFTLWVQSAWNDIQRKSSSWRWMQAEFAGQTIVNTAEYNAAAMGITRFRRWLHEGETGGPTFSIYKTADGDGDEGHLRFLEWNTFRNAAGAGLQKASVAANKPYYITVDPQDQLVLHPKPDDVYTIRGRYLKSLQNLTSNDDIPEMPEDYHEAIKWAALIKMAVFDEAMEQAQMFNSYYSEIFSDLQRTQMPPIRLVGPLV